MTIRSVKKKRLRSKSYGTLVLIAGFFLASSLLRLGSGTGSAIAREVGALSPTEAVETVPLHSCENSEGIGELLGTLKQRESLVDEKEIALANRMQALAVSEVAIQRNLKALLKAEEKLQATMAIADTAAEEDLSRLTSVYENMKAKDAAAIFEEMEPQFSAGFLGRMRSDAAAAIFANLTPSKAYSISVILAGRNVGVPTKQ